MNYVRIVSASFLLVAIAGCGTTRILRQANDVAEAGKAYATAMDALAGYALEKHIENRYNMLVGYRKSDRTDTQYYEEQLAKDTEDTVELAKSVGLFRQHTKKMGETFEALNALVDANVKDAGVASTKKAAEGLNAVGKDLVKSLHISAAQITALSNLAGIVFTELHGAEVKRFLEEYGPKIAQDLAIEELALESFAKTLNRIDKKEHSVFYEKEIRQVYVKDSEKGAARPALSGDFKTKWSAYVKEPALATQLATANEAAQKMQKAWRAILEGKENMSDILAESGKLLSMAEQAKALHENRHKPAAP